MEYYTRDMFVLGGSNINEVIAPIREEISIIEYQHTYLLDQVNEIKTKNFQELLTFERLKKQDQSVRPSLEVLQQSKELETDISYKQHMQKLLEYKKSISDKEQKIDDYKSTRLKNFTWTTYNLKTYAELAKIFADDPTEYNLKILLKMIFRNELHDSKIFYGVRWSKNYDIYQLLIDKAPSDYKTMFFHLYDAIKAMDAQIINYLYERDSVIPSLSSIAGRYQNLYNQDIELDEVQL